MISFPMLYTDNFTLRDYVGFSHLRSHLYSHGETFDCVRETGNMFDPFAVAVIRDGEIIGHVPKLISAKIGHVPKRRRDIIVSPHVSH